jgi:hypothetical protein
MPRPSSFLEHGNLPENPEVGRLRRDGGVWDWDEHRANYDLAARRAMAVLGDLDAVAGAEGAIARGLFAVATSNDEDHFAVRMTGGQGNVYKWPTVPSAEESTDVVLVGAFLGARPRGEKILEPQDIPLAVRRALIIGRNVPVLICAITEDGLVGRRFALRRDFFARLMAGGRPLEATEVDVEMSRWVTLLAPHEVAARFKDLAASCSGRRRGGWLRALIDSVKRTLGLRSS